MTNQFPVNSDVETFFGFFANHDVYWWVIETQSRKIDGERGGRLGKKFGSGKPWHWHKCGEAAARLESRVLGEQRGTRGLDGVCCESPNPWDCGRRVLLIDDLDGIALDELCAWWCGALAAIETSTKNFQAFLILADPLVPVQHHAATVAVSQKFGGDPAACGSGQLHRYPGSKNFKRELVDAGLAPFVTKLTLLRSGSKLRAREQVVQLLEQGQQTTGQVTTPRKARPPGGGHSSKDNSAQAYAWTLEQLHWGVPDTEILQALSTLWLGHHSLLDWPQRTLWNAKHKLGRVPNRYSSSKGSVQKR